MGNFDSLKKELLGLGFGPEHGIADCIIGPNNSNELTYHIKLNESDQELDLLIFKFTVCNEEISQLDVSLTRYNDNLYSGIQLMANTYKSCEGSLPTKQEICQQATKLILEMEKNKEVSLGNSTSPIIPEKLLESIPDKMRDQVRELILENRDYINEIKFNIQSIELRTSFPSTRDGDLVSLHDKQTLNPSLFEPGCKDEYAFGIHFRFSPENGNPYLFSVTTEIERFDSKSNPIGWRLESWFPDECKLPNKMEMINEVEKKLKAFQVLIKIKEAQTKQNQSLKRRL